MAIVCPKPMGREGRFWTPQSQTVVCPWAEKSFLAYFDKVLCCRTAVRLMPGHCSVSGLRHRPPSSQPSQWKCREIKVKSLLLKVSRGKEGRVFPPQGQLEFSLRLERVCLTHLGGTLFCRSGSLPCAPWLIKL